jgi:hypothetical protein
MKQGKCLQEGEIRFEVIEEEEVSPARIEAIVSLPFRWWLREYDVREKATEPADRSEVRNRKQ